MKCVSERTDPCEFLVSRAFELNVPARHTVDVEQPLRRHPVERGASQIHPIRIVVAELGFVTHDRDRASLGTAAAQKSRNARDEAGVGDAFAINLPCRRCHASSPSGNERMASRTACLRPTKFASIKSAMLRRRAEHLVVSDDGVVEIDPDAQSGHHGFIARTLLSDCLARPAGQHFPAGPCPPRSSQVQLLHALDVVIAIVGHRVRHLAGHRTPLSDPRSRP